MKKTIFEFYKEPYFYLFNLGIASAVLGVFLWIGFYSGLLNFYPIQAHGNIMFFAFLFSFVTGFLMTAVPKRTQSDPAHGYEIIVALTLGLGQWFLNLTFFTDYSIYLYTLQLIFIIYFILKRILKTRIIPFAGFIFLPFSLSLSFFAIIQILFFSAEGFKYFYVLCGEAFVLNLICGTGVRLIPVICRIPSALNPDQQGENPGYLHFFILALLLNSTFLLQFFEFNKTAFAARALFLVGYAILKFRILKKPTLWSTVGLGLRASVFGLILGYLLIAFDIGGYWAGLHVVYIAGFTLLTLMVASRVSIAHGQRSLNLEINSKSILITIGFFITATVIRYYAGLASPSVFILMASAAFLMALGNWKFFILKR